MSVSNLTNTKWVIKSQPQLVGNEHSYDFIYYSPGEPNYRFDTFQIYSGEIEYDGNPRYYGGGNWYSQQHRIIEITGGIDVTNASLIAWLEANATQIEVTNLTNTKWVINNIPTIINIGCLINFESNGNSYTLFRVSGENTDCIIYNDGAHPVYENEGSSPTWIDEAYRIISITDGTDVFNPDLLVWLNNNAILVPVVDLNGTTWIFDNSPNIYDDLVIDTPFYLNFISNNESYDGIICGNGNEYSEGMVYGIYPSSDVTAYHHEPYSYWTDNAYKTISISNGTDTSNPDLIAWLTENATYQEHTPTKTFDLSTLQLSAGTHEIKVKARATGYRDSEFSNSVVYIVTPKLATPIISRSGDTLIITPVINATSYKILVDGTQSATTSNTSFDLTTLGLSDGTYTITVIASATGYTDSNASAGESYVVVSGYNVSMSIYYGGHSQIYNGTLFYSTDNGVSWVEIPQPASSSETDSYNFVASQVKFKIVFSGLPCNGSFTISLNGTTVLTAPGSSGTYTSDNYVLSGNATVYGDNGYQCFVEGTKITLANGTTKNVEDITYDDELLVWDFYEGKFAKAKPCWIMKTQTATYYKQIVLDDGSTINLVGQGEKCHRLFNVTKQQFIYANECVGNDVYTLDGIKKVVACVIVEKEVKFYNLTTEKYLDCFAEGVLTGSRLNNMYHISNMKYDSNVRLISEKEETERWKIREALRK